MVVYDCLINCGLTIPAVSITIIPMTSTNDGAEAASRGSVAAATVKDITIISFCSDRVFLKKCCLSRHSSLLHPHSPAMLVLTKSDLVSIRPDGYPGFKWFHILAEAGVGRLRHLVTLDGQRQHRLPILNLQSVDLRILLHTPATYQQVM